MLNFNYGAVMFGVIDGEDFVSRGYVLLLPQPCDAPFEVTFSGNRKAPRSHRSAELQNDSILNRWRLIISTDAPPTAMKTGCFICRIATTAVNAFTPSAVSNTNTASAVSNTETVVGTTPSTNDDLLIGIDEVGKLTLNTEVSIMSDFDMVTIDSAVDYTVNREWKGSGWRVTWSPGANGRAGNPGYDGVATWAVVDADGNEMHSGKFNVPLDALNCDSQYLPRDAIAKCVDQINRRYCYADAMVDEL